MPDKTTTALVPINEHPTSNVVLIEEEPIVGSGNAASEETPIFLTTALSHMKDGACVVVELGFAFVLHHAW